MKTSLICALILCFSQSYSQTAEEWSRKLMGNVILLEKKMGDEFIPHGTGTIFFNYNDPRTVIVVTNEHLLRNEDIYLVIHITSDLKDTLKKHNTLRMNFYGQLWEQIGNTMTSKYPLIRDSTFIIHDSLDIAAFPILMPSILRRDTIEFKASYIRAIPKSQIKLKDSQRVTNQVFLLDFHLV
jgi:hypothetical protein